MSTRSISKTLSNKLEIDEAQQPRVVLAGNECEKETRLALLLRALDVREGVPYRVRIVGMESVMLKD
jgi:hypothetical protein